MRYVHAPTDVASAISVRFDHFCSGLFGAGPRVEVRPRFSSSRRCAWSLASRDRASPPLEERDASGFGGGEGGAGWEAFRGEDEWVKVRTAQRAALSGLGESGSVSIVVVAVWGWTRGKEGKDSFFGPLSKLQLWRNRSSETRS